MNLSWLTGGAEGCLVVNSLCSGVHWSPPQSWRHFGDDLPSACPFRDGARILAATRIRPDPCRASTPRRRSSAAFCFMAIPRAIPKLVLFSWTLWYGSRTTNPEFRIIVERPCRIGGEDRHPWLVMLKVTPKVDSLREPDSMTPLGTKGVGELAVTGMAAAIANAITRPARASAHCRFPSRRFSDNQPRPHDARKDFDT
jgi:hypothetical protein